MWIGQIRAWCKDHGRTLGEIATWGMTTTWHRTGKTYTCPIRLTTGPVGMYGGRRWYLVCPACGRRALALYLPHSAAEGQPYACRKCWRLVYPLQQERLSPVLGKIMGAAGLEGAPYTARLLDHRRMYNEWRGGFDAQCERRRNVFDKGREDPAGR